MFRYYLVCVPTNEVFQRVQVSQHVDVPGLESAWLGPCYTSLRTLADLTVGSKIPGCVI
jgi:hypothetical protein